LLGIVNFLKSLEFWRSFVYQMMQLKMHGFGAILNVCQEMVPSSQQPHEGGCWALLFCSWGTEGGPSGLLPGARYTLQPGLPPSSGVCVWGGGGTPVPPRAPCGRTQAIRPKERMKNRTAAGK
jgi:hypothetical protein